MYLVRNENPPPWWFRWAERWFPERCRRVPRADRPYQVLIYQFAIIKFRLYLQSFASGEDPKWFHSHPFMGGTLAIGLWGSVLDRRYGHPEYTRRYKAPYIRYMSATHIHQTLDPSRGHTSIFIGLGTKSDAKYFFTELPGSIVHWAQHIKEIVKRI